MGTDQSFRLFHGGLPALHGVDEVALYPVQILLSQPSLQQIYSGVADQGAFHTGHQLHALGTGIRPLIELPRQSLHHQQAVKVPGLGEALVPDHVHLRLGEHDVLCPLVDGRVNALHVVAVQDTDALQIFDTQKAPQIPQQAPRLRAESLPLFHKNSIDHYFFSSSAFSAR